MKRFLKFLKRLGSAVVDGLIATVASAIVGWILRPFFGTRLLPA